MDEFDIEVMIKERTDEACNRFLNMGAFEMLSTNQEARRQIRASASALCVLDSGFEFLKGPELDQDSNIRLIEATELPEPEPDDEIMVNKAMAKPRAFTTPIFGLLTEYSFW